MWKRDLWANVTIKFNTDNEDCGSYMEKLKNNTYQDNGHKMEWKQINKEEQVFLRLLMRDAWYDCDMRNKSQSERKLFLQIQSKLSRELINA